MTNAELISKIKAEIERVMDEYKPIVGGVDELTGAHIVLAKLLSFLSTLESEHLADARKTSPEDIEERWDELQTNFREINEAFEAGKKEQREQMMKEAVEGVLVDNIDGTRDICLHENRFGDKVRIIICEKED